MIRSVTLAGLFAPAPWMDDWELSEAGTHFYHPSDFDDMAEAGLNTVILPVPLSAWRDDDKKKKTSKKDHRKDEKKSKKDHHKDDDTLILDDLKDVLKMVRASKLQAILQLLGDDAVDFSVPDAIQEATEYAADQKHHDDTILAVELPSAKWIDVARMASTKTPLLVPLNLGQLPHLDSSKSLTDDPHTFGVLTMEHTSSVADIASSTSLDDRMKLFYHESVSCMQRAPLEYAACYHNLPVLVTGLDLSIDNCALQGVVGVDGATKFVDYGQCGRLDETTDSDWWHRHRQSFAARQLFAYEQGLGWTYPAWKLWGGGKKDDIDYSVLDSPTKLKSLKAVMKAGLVPSGKDWKHEALLDEACLNPPEPDFTLGDATLAPVPAPPPDCSPGWWNATIQDCTYWVPPPTDSPVACPVCEECPDTNAVANTTSATTTTDGLRGTHHTQQQRHCQSSQTNCESCREKVIKGRRLQNSR